jgi:hypothetical protein
MRRFARRFVMILCTLALMSGGMAAPVPAFDATDHAQHHGGAVPLHCHNEHHGAACLTCCLGACTVVADLPSRLMPDVAAFSVAAVTYWETDVSLSDRSIAPDHDPPRTGA